MRGIAGTQHIPFDAHEWQQYARRVCGGNSQSSTEVGGLARSRFSDAFLSRSLRVLTPPSVAKMNP